MATVERTHEPAQLEEPAEEYLEARPVRQQRVAAARARGPAALPAQRAEAQPRCAGEAAGTRARGSGAAQPGGTRLHALLEGLLHMRGLVRALHGGHGC